MKAPTLTLSRGGRGKQLPMERKADCRGGGSSSSRRQEGRIRGIRETEGKNR
jgi:hypothetical protein